MTEFLKLIERETQSAKHLREFCEAREGKSDDELYPACTEMDLAEMVRKVKLQAPVIRS